MDALLTITEHDYSAGREYQIHGGTAYHTETSIEIVRILEAARMNGTRIRVYYGDTGTGRTWSEDVSGRIGRSMGRLKVPLLLPNSRSMAAGAMLDHCIVRIRHSNKKNGGDLYRHPKYHVDGGRFSRKKRPDTE